MTDLPNPPVPVAMPHLSQNELVKLAHEVAQAMEDAPTIYARYSISDAQYAILVETPFYKRVLEAAIIEWEAASNTGKRTALKAAIALEDGLHILGARMKKPDENLTAAVETGKFFAKLAGIGEREGGSGVGEKITISINLGGGDKIKLERDITPTPPMVTSSTTVSPHTEGDIIDVPSEPLPAENQH